MPAAERAQAPVDVAATPVEVEPPAPVPAAVPISEPPALISEPPASTSEPPARSSEPSPPAVAPADVPPVDVPPVAARAAVTPPVARPGPRPTREPVGPPAPLAVAGPAREHPPRGEADGFRPTCTQAQLRRFIKSRPWIPMHELRRRFGILGADDDVSPIRVGDRTLYIGLPPAEGRMVGELLSAADVGCELSLDPEAPIVVGLYPMRPVSRG